MADNADDVLAKGEKVVSSGPATEGGIEQFMQGDAYMEGGRHDLEDRGMGSGVGVHQRGATLPDAQPEPAAEEASFVQDAQQAQQPQQAEQNWQQLYGQSENEKGQWRRTAEEAMQELNRIKQEMGGFQAAQQYGPPAPPTYTNPQYGYVSPTAAYPQQPQAEPQQAQTSYFPDKKSDDFLEVGDLDGIVQREIYPAFSQLYQQQLALQQQLLQAQKLNAGITPQLEQQLVAKYPWLGGIPDGPSRIQAIQELRQAQGAPQRIPTPKPPVAPSPTQPVARRVTYVESGKQQSTDREKPLQQQIAEEFHAAKTVAEKRKVLMKYGMDQVNDFGADVWTR